MLLIWLRTNAQEGKNLCVCFRLCVCACLFEGGGTKGWISCHILPSFNLQEPKSGTEMSQPGLQLKAASASAESHPIPGSILKLNFWLRQKDTSPEPSSGSVVVPLSCWSSSKLPSQISSSLWQFRHLWQVQASWQGSKLDPVAVHNGSATELNKAQTPITNPTAIQAHWYIVQSQ